MRYSIAKRTSLAAFTLVEVALAMGVASFCLVAVMALVPLGVDTSQLASDQATASSILTHVLADLRATPTTSPPGQSATSLQYAITIPAVGATTTPVVRYFGNSAQQFSSTQTQGASRYRLTVNFPNVTPDPNLPAGAVARTATPISLLVTWPARVDPNTSSTGTPTGRVQIFAGLNRN